MYNVIGLPFSLVMMDTTDFLSDVLQLCIIIAASMPELAELSVLSTVNYKKNHICMCSVCVKVYILYIRVKGVQNNLDKLDTRTLTITYQNLFSVDPKLPVYITGICNCYKV